MDINNTPCFLLADAEDFSLAGEHIGWRRQPGALSLNQNQRLRQPERNAAEGFAAWQSARALVLDSHGQLGRISNDGQRIQIHTGHVGGILSDNEGELQPPAGEFVDIALNSERLAALYSDGAEHGVLLTHLGRRWQAQLTLPDAPRRVWIDEEQQLWIVSENALFLCVGEPLPQPYHDDGERFEPMPINPRALSIVWQQALPAGQQAMAVCGDSSRIFVLSSNADTDQFILQRPRSRRLGHYFRQHRILRSNPYITDIAVNRHGHFAAMCARAADDPDYQDRDCPILSLEWPLRGDANTVGKARGLKERWPMLSQQQPRFVSCGDGKLRYQGDADPQYPGFEPRPRELHPLHKPRYRLAGIATLEQALDSGAPDTVWHRLYMEGCIPPGTKLRIFAKAYNSPDQRASTPFEEQPQLMWNPRASERPHRKGRVESKTDTAGLFEGLLQRRDGNVRRLQGRYLALRIVMESDGQQSPAIHALRIYAPRLSWQEAYLPEHFRQEQRWQDNGPANGADVRERMLASFESVLTPIEGDIAASEALLHPDSTPEQHLGWLAELLGAEAPEFWPEARRRRAMRNNGDLQRYRGTLRGLCLALDIATDGGVARGEVVVVENYRLRRTMATLLGLDFDDGDHPLTLGTGVSGNSIVGDSLILSEEDSRDFLALFAPELAETELTNITNSDGERLDVAEALFDRYSHRVTVLLHGEGRARQKAVEACLEVSMPAHVQWQLIETEHSFVLGLAPLLSVDTWLGDTPPPQTVRLDDTWLSREGILKNARALSPQAVNAPSS